MDDWHTIEPSDMRPPILSSREFVAGFTAPDWLIFRILQKHYLYSLTAPTGAGKTAIALLIAMLVADGRSLGNLDVEKGRVLYLAGENPDDVRGRWIAMAERLAFDVDGIPVNFMPGKFNISEQRERIAAAAKALKGFALIIVDTSATYFDGDEENNNVQLLDHARMLRSLTDLPGRPTVIVNCHPVKNASSDNLLPRGGGSFIAEVDGNLVCLRDGSIVDLHWQGKIRGPDFAPIPFEVTETTTDALKDTKGRPTPTVIAKPLSEQDRKKIDAAARSNEDKLLITMSENEGASMARLAEANDWFLRDMAPNKAMVQRAMKRLEKEKLVHQERGTWVLTDRGKKTASKAKLNGQLAGAHYG
jgi:hypothetical protein